MELNIVGRNLGITDRFRAYATEKSEKVTHLTDRAISLDVKLSRHNEKNGNPGLDRVELTLFGKGPVVRAEADGTDKYAAFDVALGRLLERIRRAHKRYADQVAYLRSVYAGLPRPVFPEVLVCIPPAEDAPPRIGTSKPPRASERVAPREPRDDMRLLSEPADLKEPEARQVQIFGLEGRANGAVASVIV